MHKRKIQVVLILIPLLYLAAMGLIAWDGTNGEIGRADVALVLGNKVNPDGSPSPRLKARLDTAVEFYRKGYFPQIIVSGGTGVEGVPEGAAMKRYLMEQGIPESVIQVDNQGVNTWASAGNTVGALNAMNSESVFVITQYFHIPRSKLALLKLGVGDVFCAHPAFFEPRDIYSLAREVPAYLKYLVR